MFTLLGTLAVIGWTYVFFMSDLFLVNTIEAAGLKALDQEDVSREVFALLDQKHQESWRPWPSRHSLFIDRTNLAESLRERLFAEKVNVDKLSLNIVRLTVEERSNKVIIHANQQLFWADLQGVINAELNQEERKQVQDRLNGKRLMRPQESSIISVESDEPLSVGYKVADTAMLKSWITITQKALKANIPLTEFEPSTDKDPQDVINCQDGIELIIDSQSDLETQFNAYLKFKRLNKDLLKPNSVIDVRVPGRIYLR